MIELIFAIVVMSIAMLAIPGIMEQTSSNLEAILKNEAIFQSYRTLGTIETYQWDERSIQPPEQNSHILDVTNGDSELGRYTTGAKVRKGHFNVFDRRTFFDSTTYASASLGAEAGETQKDDIDDFNGNVDSFSKSSSGYKIDMRIRQRVYYISDAASYSGNTLTITMTASPATASTNIKMIDLNITDAAGKQFLAMRAFTCNIGSTKILTKVAR